MMMTLPPKMRLYSLQLLDASCLNFSLPELVSLDLTAAQCVDRIAQIFADISHKFPSLDISSCISHGLVNNKIASAKVTKGGSQMTYH